MNGARQPMIQAMGTASAPVETNTPESGGASGILGCEGIQGEVETTTDCVGAPVAGFYTYGEIGRSRGVDAAQGQAPAALALG